MKKTIGKYIMAGMVALTMTACNDSFLDRTPTNDLNDEAYWKSAADLEAYTNGIYNEAANNYNYKFMVGFHNDAWSVKVTGPYTFDAMSDNFATMDASQTWASAVAAGIENKPEEYDDPSYAGWIWGLLRRINVFMANYERATGVAEMVRNRYAGEALFFRAWFYLYMVQNYGDVPLVTRPLGTSDEDELYGERTPRKEVMKQVLEDINAACAYLPAENWGANRLTKGAALALKARIGLYEGTYRKYHNLGDEAEFLNACVSACEELMGMGYEIYNTGNPAKDYTALFTTEDLGTISEAIFYRKYESGLKRHRMCGYTVNLRNGGTKDFVDDFLCVDADGVARPVALSHDYSNDTPEEEFTNRDPRLSQTFLAPGNEAAKALFEDTNHAKQIFPRIGNMNVWPTLTGYHPIKYFIREQDKKGFNEETHDYPLFRYAEVLLNYAEAKAELGACDQAVLDKTINVLRDRVGMPHLTVNPAMDPKYAGYGISALLVEIRRERRVELSFEFLRYQDLMRWAWGDKLKERVLGIRLEDADFANPRYEGITKGGSADAGDNPVFVFKAADGKQYIDVYENTNYATARRSFDPAKDYLRPIPISVISKNPSIGQNPGWGDN
ncbi:RagB/SusD family nutrient uptake outer membrane protein [Bacteroides sp. KH569_7]|uniref:RagB/SusD family nutrient uptake outer membrane protein n=1 Tax=Bacteroides muris (ex Fokt et al. 2023) TaxID=2937417 RepID=A0A9X2NSJ5_9BACE|nr:RagB/SusD family nutrient uptake outer membrane protein [Bacteroides muris (ex Fokt et al. 2023)]MCR6504446.1 RagB/SusD family nutrient uptake outer membrane protein [Bacteroides muris (ex Fokt et al. 2023)]MCR6507627.1 RagB/SusD family nutrient uptake outer membrane protein [Bacteroides muris (ex Fokt et al. 2023)]